jgi:outer membrane translocation and assembly module TamA
MMLYTLSVLGSMIAMDAAVPQPPATGERFYAGGFQSVRGFVFRSAEPSAARFYVGGFRSIRGFAFGDRQGGGEK